MQPHTLNTEFDGNQQYRLQDSKSALHQGWRSDEFSRTNNWVSQNERGKRGCTVGFWSGYNSLQNKANWFGWRAINFGSGLIYMTMFERKEGGEWREASLVRIWWRKVWGIPINLSYEQDINETYCQHPPRRTIVPHSLDFWQRWMI